MILPGLSVSRRRGLFATLLLTLLLLFTLFDSVAFARDTNSRNTIRFERLSLEQGLSHATALSIIQDRQGFMWFATQDGLNRYDGYHFKLFKHNPQDASSLSGGYVTTLYEDRAGVLWGWYQSWLESLCARK